MRIKAQLTLTVSEGKQLIALAVTELPELKSAYQQGKIFLKGGTTVSAIAEILAGVPLRISGRITPLGTKSAYSSVTDPHSILIENGEVKGVDDCIEEAILSMGPGDVAICGANLIDLDGNAAMMAGSPLGGNPGRVIAALAAEGITVIIPAGLEKLTPGSVLEAILAANRQGVHWSMGMAAGLIPIPGRVITEHTALGQLASVKATVIGRGGVMGAEGATTFAIEGEEGEVQKLCRLVLELKRVGISGAQGSIEECRPGSPSCPNHLSCIYAGKEKTKIPLEVKKEK